VKPVDIESYIGVDRLATWNEVTCAISVEGALGLGGTRTDLREMGPDFSESASNVAEDDMWFEIVRDARDSKSN
jgi:hypothetical protein